MTLLIRNLESKGKKEQSSNQQFSKTYVSKNQFVEKISEIQNSLHNNEIQNSLHNNEIQSSSSEPPN